MDMTSNPAGLCHMMWFWCHELHRNKSTHCSVIAPASSCDIYTCTMSALAASAAEAVLGSRLKTRAAPHSATCRHHICTFVKASMYSKSLGAACSAD